MIQAQLTKRTFVQSKNKLEILQEPPTNIQQLLKNHDPSLLSERFRKKYKKQLSIYVFVFTIKYENRSWQIKKRFTQFLDFSYSMKKKYGRETPALPIHKENQLTPSNVTYFADFLLIFLRKVNDIGIDDEQVRNFFQILPQKYGTGIIYTQVRLKKLSGGRHNEATCIRKFKTTFCGCFRNWRKRYFTVTDTCVFYTINKKSYEVKEMLPLSSHFNVAYGINLTGSDLGITLKSAYRNLQLHAQSLYEFTMLICAMKDSIEKSSYCKTHRFESFAQIRSSCYSRYYIDGQNYFSDLCDQLLKAQRFIYITGWMFTPYLLLKRPRQLDDHSCRLDYVLETVAQKGVKIYIIVYMQPKIALNNDSEFVQIYMQELHRNIRVLRHPNYILVPFLWSHHQKMVIIDQKCAFMGGLDLCYGRWDNQKHYLLNHNNLWKGADFCNFRLSDIYHPRNFLITNLDLQSHARMPWHDIAVQIRGQSINDLSRHFVQYWNFVSFQTNFNDRELLIQAGHEPKLRKSTYFWNKNPFRSSNSPNKERVMNLNQSLLTEESQQKQYYQQFLETNFKNLLEIPKLSTINQSINKNLNDLKQYPKKLLNYITEGEDAEQKEERLMISHYLQTQSKIGQQNHQILRSASMWSLGLEAGFYQKSIYEAYKYLIQNAKEFIYIENQFFICKKNSICELLAERILTAHKLGQKFKVLIMLPLLPGFEGEVDDINAAVMRVQLNWEYQTVARGKTSLLSRISSIPNPQNYLKILSLRNHDIFKNSAPVTEILYIHSKLMIVDDCKVILGSANINDRSLLGDRDSEIGILIQQEGLVQIGGRMVAKSAHDLRCELYREHFNISLEQASDYHDEAIWELISKKAVNNTQIYRQIFGCYPDNMMKTYKDMVTIKSNAKIEKYDELSKKIDGFVVEWPMYFLQKEDLTLKPSQKQFFVPQINFT